jgi:hypothetical protein
MGYEIVEGLGGEQELASFNAFGGRFFPSRSERFNT